MNDENAGLGLDNQTASPNLGSKKALALRQTIKKIIRANKSFNEKNNVQKSKNPPGSPARAALDPPPFEHSPKHIAFMEVQTGYEYTAGLSFQNITGRQIRIKVCLSKSSLFSVKGPTSFHLVPGFTQTIQVGLAPKEQRDLVDKLVVVWDDSSLEIPITATTPKGKVVFPETVDVGYVQPDIGVAFKVPLVNSGSLPVTIEFNPAGSDLILTTDSFPMTLGGGGKREAIFSTVFSRPGAFSSKLLFNLSNQSEVEVVTLTATVAGVNTFVVDAHGNELTLINFNEVFVGAEETQEFTLLNNTPVAVPYKLILGSSSKTENFQAVANTKTPSEVGLELAQQIVFLDHYEGELSNYGHRKVKIRFRKRPEDIHQYLVSKFALAETVEAQREIAVKSKVQVELSLAVLFNGGASKKVLPVKALTKLPLVSLSRQSVFFGNQVVGSTHSEDIVVTSHMSVMSIEVESKNTHFLHTEPNNLVLAPQESKVLKLKFSPKNIGPVEREVELILAKYYRMKIFVSGVGKMSAKGSQSLRCKRGDGEGMLNTSHSFRITKWDSKFGGDMSQRESRGNSMGQTARESQQSGAIKDAFNTTTGFQMVMKKIMRGSDSSAQLPTAEKLLNRTGFLPSRRLNFSDNLLGDSGEPTPTVSRQTPALYLIKPLKKGIPKQLKPLGSKFEPTQSDFFREFPSQPRSHEESQQILEKMTPEKLMRISAGPTELNFGRVFVGSSSTLHFHVRNDLWTSIRVVLDTSSLRDIRPVQAHRQVIPSSETASFRLTINSNEPKVIHEVIRYSINGQGEFNISVQAQIVLPELEVSKYNISFGFRDDSLETSMTQSVNLRNSGNLPVSFRLRPIRLSPAFRVYPAEGTLTEHQSMDVQITYTPFTTRDEETFRVEIENGSEGREIRCAGIVNEVSCDAVNPNLNFGNMAIESKKILYFGIKNSHSRNNSIFRVDEDSLPEGVEIRPRSGKICTDEMQKFEVELYAKRRVEFLRHEIRVFIRGLYPIKAYLSACILTPVVDISPLEFDFGSVVIGNKVELSFEMANRSAIQADVYLNLQTGSSQLQEIYSLLNVSMVGKATNDSMVLERLDSADLEKMTMAQVAASRATSKKTTSLEKGYVGKRGANRKREDHTGGRFFLFSIKASQSHTFLLEFAPTRPLLYSFDLMFSIQGQEKQNGLVRKVRCEATNPRFLFDPISGVVEFNRQVMLGPESTPVQKKTFTIINTSATQKLNWKFDAAECEKQTVFKVEPQEGVIDEECSVLVTIDFKPVKPMLYEATIPIIFDNQIAQGFGLKLKAEATPPKVLLSTEEIILPVTPLGVTSFHVLSLLNDGYQNSTFSLHIPSEYQKIGLAVSFVGSNMLGITNSKLLIKITFCATVSTSFTAKIAIEDDLKHMFYFSVSGSTDNSLLSYSPFLALGHFTNPIFRRNLSLREDMMRYDPDFSRSYFINMDPSSRNIKLVLAESKTAEQLVLAIPKIDPANSAQAMLLFDSSAKEDIQIPLSYYKQLGLTIKSWLLEYGVTSVMEFPEDVVSNDGGPFFDFLELLVRITIDKPRTDVLSKQSERIECLLDTYGRLLALMKENNALVSTVKPHFLLSYKDICAYFKTNAQSHVCEDFYQIPESHYRLLSAQSWATMFLQAIKIFCIARITLKDLRAAAAPILTKLRVDNPLAKGKDDPSSFAEAISRQPKVTFVNIPRGKKSLIGTNKLAIQDPKDALASARSVDRGRKGNLKSPREAEPPAEPAPIALELTPGFAFDACSIYTPSEAMLMRWLELTYFAIVQSQTRITSFSSDLFNCYHFACAVDAYVDKEYLLSTRLNREANLSDDVLNNFRAFKNFALDFGIKDEFIEADHTRQSGVAMLLLTTHLFKSLPAYFPKTTVEFTCALHEKVTKEVSITNNSSKPIIYSVKITGSKAFEADQDALRVDPKDSKSVAVTFYANTSISQEGKIYFQNRKNGKSVAGAIVFNLRALINTKYSMKVFNINNVALYELGTSEITVQNPFPKDVDLRIRLDMVKMAVEPTFGRSKSAKRLRGDSRGDKTPFSEGIPCFFIKQDRLWIRKDGEAKIQIQYLPIFYQTHKAYINFQDPKVGEMQYEVVGVPKPPPPMADFQYTIPIEEFNLLELDIPLFNRSLVAAVERLIEKLKENRDFISEVAAERLQKNIEKDFDVEVETNEYFAMPTPLSINAKVLQEILAQASPANSPSGPGTVNPKFSAAQYATSQSKIDNADGPKVPEKCFKFSLAPLKKVPVKDLCVALTFKGRHAYDFRIYNLQLSVLPKKIKATIEMKTTARVPIVQNIPISNTTDYDCTIRPKFTPLFNGNFFECSTTQFTVKRKTVAKYPLRFSCPWIESAECQLSFFNLLTNETFEYTVKGEADEPLSEDHLQFQAKAKSRKELVFRVRNPITDCRNFRVQCDIPNAQYDKKVTFDDSHFHEFKVSFVPLVGGNLLYSLTFTDDTKRYFWYLISLEIDSPESTKTISLSTEVRMPVIGKIDMDNPTDQLLKLKPIIQGEFITGDLEFEIPPNSKATYTFFYFPLRVETVKRKIGFTGEDKSETWYDIECRAEEPRMVKLPMMKSEIGKSSSQNLTFMNPLKKKVVTIRTEIPERSNFKVNPRVFDVPPNESVEVELAYTPRDLHNMESQVIRFTSREIGNWNYQAFGIGVPPTENEPISVTTTIKSPVTRTIFWKNPFLTKIPIKIGLEGAAELGTVLEIVTPKQPEVLIAPMGTCHVIVRFAPTQISTYNTRLIIRATDLLQWVYPIKAVAEAVSESLEYVVKTKCEVETEVVHHFLVPGLNMIGPEEHFDYDIIIDHPESENIHRWLRTRPIRNKLSDTEESLSFAFYFLPHKPLKANLEFVLNGHSGGRWRFKLVLLATEPDFFDVLTIVSQLGIARAIRFRLYNSDKKNSNPFTARFEDEGQTEFMVTPNKGSLEPKINDGNLFEVTYCPKKYGKPQSAILHIETDQHLFRFLIKGSFEKYVPPK